jgi:hypothetical protein
MPKALRRTLLSAAVGVALVLIWWTLFTAAPNLTNPTCSDLGCALTSAYLTIAVIVVLSMLIGWIILTAVGVRPAALVAIVSPIIAWVIGWLADPAFGSGLWRYLVPVAVGYGIAGLLTTRQAK